MSVMSQRDAELRANGPSTDPAAPQKVYLAVRHDRHVDDHYAAFYAREAAIEWCRQEARVYKRRGYDDVFTERLEFGWEFYLASHRDDGPYMFVQEVALR